jgi:hypothetical protein
VSVLPELKNRRPKLPREVVLVRELESFEGPILSEYRAVRGSAQYIEKWCARSEGVTRILLVRADQRAIAEYLGKRRTLLSLLIEPSDGVGYVIDRRQGETVAVYGVYLDELPTGYLPKPTVYHDENLRPEWDTLPQSYLIENNWDAKLFSDIERINLNVSGFAYFTQPNTDRALPGGLLNIHYDGGYPIMHVYNGIRASLPEAIRPRAAAVDAASPGVFTLATPTSTADMIRRALLALPRCTAAVEAVHAWSRLRPEAAQRVSPVARESLHRLCSLLSVRVDAILPPTTSAEQEKDALLVAGKLIVSYYKMLWRLVEPSDRAEYLGEKVEKEDPDVSSYDDNDGLSSDDEF